MRKKLFGYLKVEDNLKLESNFSLIRFQYFLTDSICERAAAKTPLLS